MSENDPNSPPPQDSGGPPPNDPNSPPPQDNNPPPRDNNPPPQQNAGSNNPPPTNNPPSQAPASNNEPAQGNQNQGGSSQSSSNQGSSDQGSSGQGDQGSSGQGSQDSSDQGSSPEPSTPSTTDQMASSFSSVPGTAEGNLHENISDAQNAASAAAVNASQVYPTLANTAEKTAGGAAQAGEGVAAAPVNVAKQLASGRVPVSLICTDPSSAGMVYFDFNPEKIVFSRSLTWKAKGSGTPDIDVLGTPTMTINISKIIFEGQSAKQRCDQLLEWASPAGGITGRLNKLSKIKPMSSKTLSNIWEKAPLLRFSWGPPKTGFLYQVVITNINIQYVRFTLEGIPTRAEVSLTMLEQPSKLAMMPTNPTSGGLPGRQEHLVTQGDNLQGIAVEYFGAPGRWREIAKINKIYDPTRLRPGQRIFIPHPDEFIESETA